MDLIANTLFRVTCTDDSHTECDPGLYRVILNDRPSGKVVAVLIEPGPGAKPSVAVGRPKKADKELARPRKKPPKPLIGRLLWLDYGMLEQLHADSLLRPIEMARLNLPALGKRSEKEYKRRVEVMAEFLDLKKLQEGIVNDGSLSGLVTAAMRTHRVSRSFVYTQWSNLCRLGIDQKSLIPRRDLCGAPGVSRPCDPLPDGSYSREKAGRKTVEQQVAQAYGEILPPEQLGMSTDWANAILAADRRIPTPKPSWPERCNQIAKSSFLSRCEEVDGKTVLCLPEKGQYPNDRQIQRVLQSSQTRIERVLEKTTKRHFATALRGLTARAWQGVAGPGHTWAIDSTIGDIYLRSSVNRKWVVGRPIVYIIVDMWSTAIVGFHVCLTGPSWNTAKVSLFSAAADPALVAELWDYVPIKALDPAPTLCYSLLCDRGEYLSQGHQSTALKLSLPLSSYTPPYRGDLKGLVEVLHRIRKDEQFRFIPGAIDYRRKEMELRKFDPNAAALTVREYVHLLYLEFTEYNLAANRENRMDAHMLAEGVFPSPAGLWHWGHKAGIGYRRHVASDDLITDLLPSSTGTVARDGVHHAGCHYMSDMVKEQQWTTIARNLGSSQTQLNYFPGAMGPIWVPNRGANGLLRLQLADESRVSAEATLEEWSDARAIQTISRLDVEHQRKLIALQTQRAKVPLIAQALQLNAEALAKSSGSAPTMSKARTMEVAFTSHPSASEQKTAEALRDENIEQHEQLLMEVLQGADELGFGNA